MKAEEFDNLVDSGNDLMESLDLTQIRRPELEQRRVNVDFPIWMINSLDKVAKRTGVPRQSIIKVWLSERLDVENQLHAV